MLHAHFCHQRFVRFFRITPSTTSPQATLLHPDEKQYSERNYVVSFEGEIEVQAETQVKAENQAYDQLSHLGQITVVAFKKEEK